MRRAGALRSKLMLGLALLATGCRGGGIGTVALPRPRLLGCPRCDEAALRADRTAAIDAVGAPACGPVTDVGAILERDRRNRAVAHLLRSVRSDHGGTEWLAKLGAAGIAARGATPELNPALIDRVTIAEDRRVVGDLPIIRRDGLGVPVIVRRRFAPGRRGADALYPRIAHWPATAVLEPPTTPGANATLVLYDPLLTNAVNGYGTNQPLAADFTTALVQQLGVASGMPQYEYVGLIKPSHLHENQGVLAIEPYRPGRVPVLILHGMLSNPKVWLTLINTLRADPVLRERFQFWVALYPTSYPLPESAALLRESIRQIRESLDPGHVDPALDRIVVIGKSTGGNVAKMLAQSSGTGVWDAVFARPFDAIHAGPELRAWLAATFFFAPEPSVARLVFVATPHRGSALATQRRGRLATGVMRRGDPLRAAYSEVRSCNGPLAFQSAYQDRPPNTVDNLEIASPLLEATARLPIAAGVPYHSIIAAKPCSASGEEMTDGIVRYGSAHLDGAASERTIASNHFCEASPELAEEVRRILHLHLQESFGR